MMNVAFVEMQCSKCKGTIAPGCSFFEETLTGVVAIKPATPEEKANRLAAGLSIGVIEVRLCYDCFEEL